jgi:hypothetical protein
MKLRNPKLIPFVFVFLVATPLSCCLSGINTWRQFGFSENFLSTWMSNWLIGFLMVYPLALIFVAIAKKTIAKLTN